MLQQPRRAAAAALTRTSGARLCGGFVSAPLLRFVCRLPSDVAVPLLVASTRAAALDMATRSGSADDDWDTEAGGDADASGRFNHSAATVTTTATLPATSTIGSDAARAASDVAERHGSPSSSRDLRRADAARVEASTAAAAAILPLVLSLPARIADDNGGTRVSDAASGLPPGALAVSLSAQLAPHVAAMAPADVGVSIGILQRVAEAANTRLDEAFLAAAAFRVFSADVERDAPAETPAAEAATLALSASASAVGERAALSAAVAATMRAVAAAGFLNDDYLTGVGLARCADLAAAMEVPALLDVLEALRRLARVHFTFAEAEWYRARSSATARAVGDLFAHFAAADAGARRRREPVAYPNLVALVTEAVERRVAALAGAALRQSARRAVEERVGVAAQRALPARSDEEAGIITIDLDNGPDNEHASGGGAGGSGATHAVVLADTPARPSPGARRSVDSAPPLVPLCRPNELAALVRELCQTPFGTSADGLVWRALAAYARRYLRPRSAVEVAAAAEDTSSSSLVALDALRKPMMSAPPPLTVAELVSMVGPLVQPTAAIHDALDAVAGARSSAPSAALLVRPSDAALAALPTAPLLAVVCDALVLQQRAIVRIARTDPDVIRSLRRAFETHPALFHASPALWDVVRLAHIPRAERRPVAGTGVDASVSKLGEMPLFRSPRPPAPRVPSRKWMPLQTRFLPRRVDPAPFGRQRPAMQRIRLSEVKWKRRDFAKLSKFSKRRVIATRLPEAPHQRQ